MVGSDTPVIQAWHNHLICSTRFSSYAFVFDTNAPFAVATVCAVFAVCSIIDRLRLLTVEPLFMRCVDRLLNYKISKH